MSLSKRFRDATKLVQFMNNFESAAEEKILKTDVFVRDYNDGHESRSYRWAEMEPAGKGEFKVTEYNAEADGSGLSSDGFAISSHQKVLSDPADNERKTVGAAVATKIMGKLEDKWKAEGFTAAKTQPFTQQNYTGKYSNNSGFNHC